jgi:hypothetical protein
MVCIQYPLILILCEIEELMMKLSDEMVMMMELYHVVVVVVVVVDMKMLDLVHKQAFDFVDEYPNNIIVVLQVVTYVDKMYLDVIHLLVDDHVVNWITTNESNDTRKNKN